MSKKKILIIDDEPDMAGPTIDRLEFKYPDEFIYAQYTEEGLLILRNENISCLSLDLIMPVNKLLKYKESLINGINTLKQIREIYPTLPIACYTVVSEEETIQTITSLRAEYIKKSDENAFYNLFRFFEKNHPK